MMTTMTRRRVGRPVMEMTIEETVRFNFVFY